MTSPRIETLRKLLAGRPDDPRIQYGLAVELLKQGSHVEGVALLSQYLEAGVDEGAGWGQLGEALWEMERPEEARQACLRGIEVAERHSHPTLAEDLREILEGWE
ncbi:MAG: hypothetical protein WEA09_14230 [Gemmatimonadota bacterium]